MSSLAVFRANIKGARIKKISRSQGAHLDITPPSSYQSDKGDLPELSIANPLHQRKLITGQLFLSACLFNVASGSTATGCVTLLSNGRSLRESL